MKQLTRDEIQQLSIPLMPTLGLHNCTRDEIRRLNIPLMPQRITHPEDSDDLFAISQELSIRSRSVTQSEDASGLLECIKSPEWVDYMTSNLEKPSPNHSSIQCNGASKSIQKTRTHKKPKPEILKKEYKLPKVENDYIKTVRIIQEILKKYPHGICRETLKHELVKRKRCDARDISSSNISNLYPEIKRTTFRIAIRHTEKLKNPSDAKVVAGIEKAIKKTLEASPLLSKKELIIELYFLATNEKPPKVSLKELAKAWKIQGVSSIQEALLLRLQPEFSPQYYN